MIAYAFMQQPLLYWLNILKLIYFALQCQQ